MGGRAWLWLGALALGAWLGCGPSQFLCETDAGCERDGAQGVCQPSGSCSFPDETCESGQRYGELAESMLAGICVELEATTSDSTGPSTSTSDTEPGGTTLGVDESGPTSDPSADDGTTGPVDASCWFDGFDDDSIDADWCPVAVPGLELSEHDDMLWVEINPDEWTGRTSQVSEIASCSPRPLLGLSAVAHVEVVPQASPFTEAFLEVGNDAYSLGVGVIDGMLYAFVFEDGAYSGAQWQAYDYVGHHFWRVRGTTDGLFAEVSSDEVTWSHLHAYGVDLTGEEGKVSMGVWSETMPLELDRAGFDSLEICSTAE
ncbi:hypothetical protein [Paraliomyxa miuraensis]|uniref:hypothetical protein n=1 Tax=Paraliomyxa miuraensis TaxID=376150 RepID=UPI00224E1DD3|nr:hypothetical protein [Paraliomyxa miuraensis]MCX4247162.1 hypothetical protein [Paraliomyxa miuraensis]